MADLQSCYFCGAPDDIGEYAVVPPRLGGGDRSVVLCPDCKTKLLRVMEPLIERAEGGADGEGAANDPTGAQSAADAGGDPAPETDEVTMSSGERSGDGSAASGEETTESTVSTATAGEETPPQYRRAMRMLSNRPFPVDRAEAESMLANAYDLEREEIEAVLSHAASEGRLVVEDGQIREP